MTRCKVVEDSDDDGNAEATPPRRLATGLSDITLSTLVSLNGSPSHEVQEQSIDPSTSSSELLNREARAAHSSLVELTPRSTNRIVGPYYPAQQQTPTPSTASRLKTKRSKTSIEKPKAKKPLKTYGKGSQDIFEFHGGSDGELNTVPRMDQGHKPEKCKSDEKRRIDRVASSRGSQDEDVARNPIFSSSKDTELLDTERRRYDLSSVAENERSLKSSMPARTSKSTSLDQSQPSQTDKLPTIADPTPSKSVTSNTLPPAVATYSEAHSDDRMSAPVRPSSETDEERSQDLAPNVKSQSMRLDAATRHVDPHSTEDLALHTWASEVLPSRTATIEGTNRSENFPEELNVHLETEHHFAPFDHTSSTVVNPVVLLPVPTDTEGTQDELSLSIPEAASKSLAEPPKMAKRKRDADDEPLDEPGFDDNTFGVPIEHYQPRPSKRRSGGREVDIVVPTDFSKRPEAIGKGKRKTKRHKTTAFQELLPKEEGEGEEEEIKVIPDGRFAIPEKKKPKTSTESDQPDLEIRPETQPELNQVAKSSGQKKRGRPKKVVTNLSEETIVDETEDDHDQDGAEKEGHVISATANKSRKKTKSRQTAMPIIDEQEGSDNSAPTAQNNAEAPSANVNILNETNGNVIPPNLTTSSPPSTSSVKANAPPETPHRPTTPASKWPDKHSPISIGKVAHRVGLSKRARIAPLLRIVRK